MKLKRSLEEGKVVFRDVETGEIIKTETAKGSQQNSNIPGHESGTGTALTVFGYLSFGSVIVILILNAQSPFNPALVIAGIAITILSGILLIALGQVVFHAQYQTKLLKEILKNTIRESKIESQ